MPKQNIPILGKEKNVSKNIELHRDEELTLEKRVIEKNYRNLRSKSLDNGSRAKNSLLGSTLQVRLHRSKSSSSLKEVTLGDQKLAVSIHVSNIKYNYPEFQNNALFYLFYNLLDYILTKYFAESKTTKNKVDKFLSKLLMAPLTEKLSY